MEELANHQCNMKQPDTDPLKGLQQKEAEKNLKVYGYNEVLEKKVMYCPHSSQGFALLLPVYLK